MNDGKRMVIGTGLVALSLALFAQTTLDLRLAPTGWLIGLLAFALAAVAFAVSFGSRELACAFSLSTWQHTAPLRDRWLLVGANLAGVAFFTLGSNHFTIIGTLAWLGAIVAVVWMATHGNLASIRFTSQETRAVARRKMIKHVAAMVAVTLLAAFF